ncbi:HAMP domain-containing histidine kinase [Paraglaciecola aquimarina]|uniref:histidine kinase n=1 Tax=Paraglaciecola algarum TaxID=3050085 RepID=A0ABS9D9H7_9ALTE|nr:HAMP domain-containing sensor histidine kinase [Paraglaciecola sp. G1-23]MCF2948311.1 HAMP domain-containing histidine kinase [Paraglaciecola sp. G1-23]
MQSLQLVSTEKNHRNMALASQRLLDDIRANAMENLLNSGSLSTSLISISDCLENVLGSCHCQVLSFNSSESRFNVINKSNRTHTNFVTNFVHKMLNSKTTEITKNLLNKTEFIYSDIYQSRECKDLHIEGKELGVVAAWTIPLVSHDGILCGAYLCLFNTVRHTNDSELDLLHRAASSVSALIFHGKQKTAELKNKISLQKTISKQDADLNELNLAVKKAIIQRTQVQTQLIELENMAALGTMMSSLTHEINTPIGVSITASSYLSDLQQECFEKLELNQLKRSELITYLQEAKEASYIIQRNVQRADELINTFKRLSIDQDSQDLRSFNLCHYVYEVLLSLKPRLKMKPHKFCIDISDELNISSNPGALSQVLINLIMNSVHHAFLPNQSGRITIKASLVPEQSELLIYYKDNGVGMDQETIQNIYKPFFSLAGSNESSGLGMHICSNIVMKVLNGSLTCQSELGKGSQFEIRFPV